MFMLYISGAEASFDDGSSLLGEGSHKSLAGTSVTSTADLSIFSTATRSQALDVQSIDSDEGQTSSGRATPLAVPRTSSSPDVVRIFVPYVTPSQSPIHIPQNGDLVYRQDNKIRIKIVEQSSTEDVQTPIVEQNSSFMIASRILDLNLQQ